MGNEVLVTSEQTPIEIALARSDLYVCKKIIEMIP